ncbi:MAG: M20/M25/M40 family metallo-hydrolase [Eubacteriales bacterium]|jgi:arginine utilization protein RocB|nr:M20/M25/M40 family metallo-hydrolase [Eubacteriales bacterium]MDD4445519.1 M20/M25/M40 family metallo-hydrolase [Eubacteriales bacterium]
MNAKIAKRVEEIALDLASTLSVVETRGEVEIAEKVHGIFAGMDYYKANPQNLYYVDVKDDALGRKSVIAILEGGKAKSDKTVLMIGHIDSVGVSDYGNLKEYANQPLKLTEKFKELELPPAVKADLESGEYLFGRGLFDMKAGDAVIMAIMEMISEDIDNFEGNLVFAAVCDEEGNSAGMLSCVGEFGRIRAQRGYDYLALLDADYITEEYEGDPNKYIYIGTVGKVMPTFYVVGKETHVGESFKGIDPNQIAAAITGRINLNPEFSDVADGEVTLPPITLKQRDLKTEYSVQIAKSAVVFFNYATHCSTPEIILEKMIKAGEECFREVVDTLNERYQQFCEMAKREFKPLPWVPRVMSFDQLCSAVRKEVSGLDEMILEKARALMTEDMDSRDRSTRIVEFVHNLWSDKNPVIIVYFSQPYYPHVYVEGKLPKEKALLEAVEAAVKETKSDYKLGFKKFFPYISDLSYGAVPEEEGVVATFQENMPGYGITYDLPFDEIRALNLPVLDIGAFGKDAHKFTERIEKKYTFNVAPELLYRTIVNLLK